jgi:putative ABC transport system permease protein
MIRWEAILVSVFGTVGGIALGVFLGWAIVKAAGEDQGIATFAAPPQQLLIILLAGWLVGVIASIRPARRAAKLEILQAIAAE